MRRLSRITNDDERKVSVVNTGKRHEKIAGVAVPPFCESTAVTIASLHRFVLEAAHEFHMPEAQFSVSKYNSCLPAVPSPR